MNRKAKKTGWFKKGCLKVAQLFKLCLAHSLKLKLTDSLGPEGAQESSRGRKPPEQSGLWKQAPTGAPENPRTGEALTLVRHPFGVTALTSCNPGACAPGYYPTALRAYRKPVSLSCYTTKGDARGEGRPGTARMAAAATQVEGDLRRLGPQPNKSTQYVMRRVPWSRCLWPRSHVPAQHAWTSWSEAETRRGGPGVPPVSPASRQAGSLRSDASTLPHVSAQSREGQAKQCHRGGLGDLALGLGCAHR